MRSKLDPEFFVENLAQAFVPGSTVGFKIEATRTKNTYYIAFQTKTSSFMPDLHMLWVGWSEWLKISNMNSLMKKTNPEIMFRATPFMSLDHLCTTYGLKKTDVCKCILDSIKKKIKDATKYNDTAEVKAAMPWNYYDKDKKSSVVAQVSSIDELAVWVDLRALTHAE